MRTGGFEPPHPCGYWDLNPARLPDSATSASPVRVARGGGASGSEDGVALACLSSRRSLAGRRLCRGPECVLAVVFVEFPVVVVYEVVAPFAQQGEVVDVGGAASAEPFDVVGFGSFDG